MLKIRRTLDGYLVADVNARGANDKERTFLQIVDILTIVDNFENTDEAIKALRSLCRTT